MSPTSLLGFTRAKTIAGFAIREFWQPPYRRLPWHEHQEASICYVVAGSYMERVRGLDRQCSRYTMVFKPPRERHADQFGDLGGTCLLIEIDAGRLKDIEPFSDITKNPSVVQNAKLATLGHHIYREFAGGDHFSPLAIEGLILELLAETSRAGLLDATSNLPGWLRQARDLVHDGFCGPLTLSSVAQAVGVHPSHLARAFRKHYHWSVGAYVRHLRIERASREIADTNAPLSTIGLRTGFFDQSHFSKVFKQHTGMTPAQFRFAAGARNFHTNPPRTS